MYKCILSEMRDVQVFGILFLSLKPDCHQEGSFVALFLFSPHKGFYHKFYSQFTFLAE